MLFSSLPFLFYFLPIVLILYFIVPKSLKNVVLLHLHYFYGWGEPKYVILMIVSILLGYIFGLLIENILILKSESFCYIINSYQFTNFGLF